MQILKRLFTVSFMLTFFCTIGEGQKRYKQYPIIRHQANSPLPDTMQVIGELSGKPDDGYCGFVCIGGMIKVQLKDSIPGYPHKFVYIVTACLAPHVKPGTKVDIIATKLRSYERECYYNSIWNGFDSKGVPFYKLSEKETRKIY
jgi:hypothetical protein